MYERATSDSPYAFDASAKAFRFSAIEYRLWWVCIPEPLIPIDRLGHERRVQAVLLGDRLERELEGDRVVGGPQRVAVLEVDLVLAGRDLVVGRLDPDAERLEGVDHVLADFLGEVGREVEVAGLIVGQRRDRAVLVAPEQEELELRARCSRCSRASRLARPGGAGRRAGRRRTARRAA